MPRLEISLSKSTELDSPLNTFVACAHQMLDGATPEPLRRTLEPKLLAQLPVLRALGVFDLFEVRDPALRAWLADELETLARASTRPGVTLLKQT